MCSAGRLARDGLALQVIDMPSAAERLAWLDQVLPTLPGTGIIYCLTVRDVERVGTWLRSHGHNVLQYTGGTDHDLRLEAEAALQRNEVKALVATTALGMGYDKPDLSFVIHFQSPGSPVGYYQQVGRAGRQLTTSIGVLLRGVEDSDIQDWFITTAFPSEEDVNAVLAVFATATGPVAVARILEQVNMRRGELDKVLTELVVDGVLSRLSRLGVRADVEAVDVSRRAVRCRHRRSSSRAGADGRVRERRWMSDGVPRRGPRRSLHRRLRDLRQLHRCRGLPSRSIRRWSPRRNDSSAAGTW